MFGSLFHDPSSRNTRQPSARTNRKVHFRQAGVRLRRNGTLSTRGWLLWKTRLEPRIWVSLSLACEYFKFPGWSIWREHIAILSFFGIACLQTLVYYQRFPNDRKIRKISVSCILPSRLNVLIYLHHIGRLTLVKQPSKVTFSYWSTCDRILELTTFALIVHVMYYYLIRGWGNILILDSVVWWVFYQSSPAFDTGTVCRSLKVSTSGSGTCFHLMWFPYFSCRPLLRFVFRCFLCVTDFLKIFCKPRW